MVGVSRTELTPSENAQAINEMSNRMDEQNRSYDSKNSIKTSVEKRHVLKGSLHRN